MFEFILGAFIGGLIFSGGSKVYCCDQQEIYEMRQAGIIARKEACNIAGSSINGSVSVSYSTIYGSTGL